jgi:hypothetical protein
VTSPLEKVKVLGKMDREIKNAAVECLYDTNRCSPFINKTENIREALRMVLHSAKIHIVMTPSLT